MISFSKHWDSVKLRSTLSCFFIRVSVDYSEWDSDEQSKLNDDTEEAEGKEEEEEEVEAEKGMFKQLFEKFKNWIRKIGKRKTQD